MREYEVAIIGAGIAGAALAYRLAGQRSVLLLEREAQPGHHATGRSAAMFMESYGPAGVRALTRASRQFYEEPPPDFGPAVLQPRGVLYLAVHGQEQLLQDTWRQLSATGCEVEMMNADAVLACVPCLRPDVVHGALHEPGAQDIDVHALHQGFLRGLRAGGSTLRTGAQVIAAERAAGGWTIQLADGERVQAQAVVNAAGAWADEVAALFAAAPVALVPHRRSAFTFTAPAGADVSSWPAVVGADESYYFKPDAGRLLGSPANADATVPHDVQPEELDIALGIHRIEAVSTLTIRRPASTWAGLRSFVRDGELVIGWDDTCPGFFWLAAQGGYGIQSAAGASALAASLLLHQPLPDELARHGVDPRAMSPARLR